MATQPQQLGDKDEHGRELVYWYCGKPVFKGDETDLFLKEAMKHGGVRKYAEKCAKDVQGLLTGKDYTNPTKKKK